MSDAINETPNVLVRLKYYSPNGGNGTYSGRRSFYAGDGADDYMKYIDKGIDDGNIGIEKHGAVAGNGGTGKRYEKSSAKTGRNDRTDSTNNDYMDYVCSDAKSTGVFGKDGILTKQRKAGIRRQLRATDSNVWDMIISFKSEYGDRYMRNSATAQGLLKAHLNRFFKNAGLNPDNTVWFAGLHENTDNRHIHVCFFERDPIFLRREQKGKYYHHGKLRQTGIDAFKLAIEQYFSDTTMQLKADRAELIAAARESVNYDKQLKDRISRLADLLPSTGRLGYDSGNMKPLRPIIDGITDHIIRNYPPARNAYLTLCSRLNKRDDEIRESCRKQRITNVGVFLVKDTVLADLYRRIGNRTIGFALRLRQRRETDKRARLSNASPIKRRIARRGFLSSLRECLKLKAIAETECMRDFENYLKRLEEAAPDARYGYDEPQSERNKQSEAEMD